MRLYLKVLVSLLAATFVWLLAPSAHAAAPLCDARGATTFAPNPTLEEPNSSVDIGQADDCGGGATTDDLALSHGKNSPSSEDGTTEDLARALAAISPTILPASFANVLEDAASTFALPNGTRSRVDRPPR